MHITYTYYTIFPSLFTMFLSGMTVYEIYPQKNGVAVSSGGGGWRGVDHGARSNPGAAGDAGGPGRHPRHQGQPQGASHR